MKIHGQYNRNRQGFKVIIATAPDNSVHCAQPVPPACTAATGTLITARPETKEPMIELSIIIPAYNEGNKISRDIHQAAAMIAAHTRSGELIIVDDGSEDGTAAIARRACDTVACPCTVLQLQPNRGKGRAVREGILRARGETLLFADAGSNIPWDDALKGLGLLAAGCDIAHGSRYLPGSRIRARQPLRRRLASRLFRPLMRRVMGIPPHLSDSQCGFKLYRREVARALYSDCTTDGFMFDIEIILRAEKAGYRICEFPVSWRCDYDSRISLLRHALPTLRDLVRIKRLFSR